MGSLTEELERREVPDPQKLAAAKYAWQRVPSSVRQVPSGGEALQPDLVVERADPLQPVPGAPRRGGGCCLLARIAKPAHQALCQHAAQHGRQQIILHPHIT